MRHGHKARFKRRRRQVHTFFQHQVEEALEAFNIALHDVLIAGHGWRIGEENPEHAADVIDHQWDTRLFCGFQQTVSQLSRQVGQGFVNTWLRHFGQAGEACCHRNRVAGKGTSLVDRARWRQRFHHILTAAECANRHSAADDFAEAGKVRLNAIIRLGTRQRYAEAGHHFVDDQQGTKLIAQGAQARQEVRLRWNAVHVARYRFNDDAGDLLWILLERRANGVQIVIGTGQGMLSEIRRHARRVWLAEGQRAGACFHQ